MHNILGVYNVSPASKAASKLEQDIANYSVLTLTLKARTVLRGEQALTFAKPRIRTKLNKKKEKKTATPISDIPCDQVLFEALRVLCKTLADKAGVPPFVVFSDASLMHMSSQCPVTREEFAAINGVGDFKFSGLYICSFIACSVHYSYHFGSIRYGGM